MGKFACLSVLSSIKIFLIPNFFVGLLQYANVMKKEKNPNRTTFQLDYPDDDIYK